VWLDKDRYIDLGYQDPYSPIRKAVIAAMRGKSPKEAAWEAAKEAMGPFAEMNLTLDTIGQAVYNRSDTGRQVWNPTKDLGGISADIAKYMFDKLQPGLIYQGRRIYDAATGQKKRNLRDELISLGGVRISKLDPAESLYYRAMQFGEEMRGAKSIYNSSLAKGVKGTNLEASKAESQKALDAVWEKMSETVAAAHTMGMNEKQIVESLKRGNVSAEDAQKLARGARKVTKFKTKL
jgi:hypothetical protein